MNHFKGTFKSPERKRGEILSISFFPFSLFDFSPALFDFFTRFVLYLSLSFALSLRVPFAFSIFLVSRSLLSRFSLKVRD